MRFTVDGTSTLEKRIAEDMTRIREAVLEAVGTENITALVLGGGYGRGEGGIYVVNDEERVYNDYDFFVVVPFKSRRRRNWVSSRLRGVKEHVEPGCGIHVDFSPPMPLKELPRLPYELMFMEAKAGHHVVYGPEKVFETLPEYDMQRPPLDEGARLFMNRGVGLLLARGLMRKGLPLEQDGHEFVVRNLYKAMMAMGDSVLIVNGAYSPSYVERLRRFANTDLTGVPEGSMLEANYNASIDFKLSPQHDVPNGKTLATWCTEIVALYEMVFLWYERRRLRIPGLTWSEYVGLRARLPWAGFREAAKNTLRHLRTESGNALGSRGWYLHPRDHILRCLPRLLFEEQTAPEEEACILRLWERHG